MTNEIKEILDILERRLPFAVAPEFAYMTAIITPQECKILLDYITNLQEEIKRQEKAQVILDNQNAELKEENITLREQIRTYYKPKNELNKHKYEILQQRIDKAIFYMRDGMTNYPFTMYKVDQIDVRKLLQILQGEDNECNANS